MNILNSSLVTTVLTKTAPAVFKTKQHAPDILVGVGILSGLASGFLFAKAYKRHDEVLEDLTLDIVETRMMADEGQLFHEPTGDDHEPLRMTKPEVAQVMYPMYGHYARKFVGLYGLPTLTTGLSLYCLLTGHGIIRGRNQALIASTAVLEQSFQAYRRRVIEATDEATDERYYTGAEAKMVSVEEEQEDGTVKKVRRKMNTIPEDPQPMLYSRIFDNQVLGFSPDRELNRYQMQVQEEYWNHMLRIKGYVVLNDVYKALNIPASKEGMVAGWSLAKKEGDNFISFGLDLPINQNVDDNRWFLDFNVNGSIYDHVD